MNELTQHLVVKLDFAIFEAERFIKKARDAKIMLKAGHEGNYRSFSFAAAKRASMDLSRALSTLRHKSIGF